MSVEIQTPADKGMTPGRKMKAFLWLSLSVTTCAATLAKIGAPENVIINALWIIGFGGIFCIGGQTLIDSIAKWSEGRK